MIYVVSGFMRSGTSMMMEALQAGGMPIVHDHTRDEVNDRASDEHYRPNPNALFEPAYTREMLEPGWPRQYDGRAVKVVIPFVPNMSVHDYRVVIMRRDPEEIRQSLEAAFGMKRDLDYLSRRIDEGVKTIYNRKDVRDITELNYRDVVTDPASLQALDWPFDLKAAMGVINVDHYRFRKHRLAIGA